MASPPRTHPPSRQNSVGFGDANTASASSSNTRPTTHSRTSSLLNFSFRSKASAAHAHSQSQPLQTVQEHTQQPANQAQGPQQQNSTNRPASTPSMDRPTPLTPNAVQQDQPPPPPPHQRTNSVNQPPQLHPEIRSIVQLSVAHAHKVYFSGPLIRRIERLADGNRPHKEEGWRDVWAQLGGTTLSVWDMQEIEEANKRGEEVPPTYVNITDAFVQILGSITIPSGGDTPAKKYTNVITLNTAGANLLLFACPSTQALISWATALRLSAWEKSRLEEIYTAHLLRMSLSENGVWKDPRSPLVRGRVEGWVQLRIAGQTDWKRLWLVVQGGSDNLPSPAGAPKDAQTQTQSKKNRMSNLFSRPHSPPHGSLPPKSRLEVYPSNKGKDRKKPILTMTDVSQVFAVYPERADLISRSTLVKVEGLMGDEEAALGMRSREAWVLLMPEADEGKLGPIEMLKWLVGLHDAFSLYGRPSGYTWDPRNPISMMFAYPHGPNKDLLFLDRELAEMLDPRDDRTSAIRSNLNGILVERMRKEILSSPGGAPPTGTGSPSLPPIQSMGNPAQGGASQQNGHTNGNGLMQLPPLDFGGSAPPVTSEHQNAKSLTPITERSSSVDKMNPRQGTADNLPSPTSHHGFTVVGRPPPHPHQKPEEEQPAIDRKSDSPSPTSSSLEDQPRTATPLNVGPRFSQVSLNSKGMELPRSGSTDLGSPLARTNPAQVALPPSVHSPGSEVVSMLTSPRTSSPLSPRGTTSPVQRLEMSPRSINSSVAFVQQQQLQQRQPNVPTATQPSRTNTQGSGDLQRQGSSQREANASDSTWQSQSRDSEYVFDEAGVVYLRQQEAQNLANQPPYGSSVQQGVSERPGINTTSSPLQSQPPSAPAHSPLQRQPLSAFEHLSATTSTGLMRRPSGARAQPPSSSSRLQPNAPVAAPPQLPSSPPRNEPVVLRRNQIHEGMDDSAVDALAALSFLERENVPTEPSKNTNGATAASPTSPVQARSPPQINEPGQRAPSPPTHYKSSFAPSKNAVERKARSQAQQAAHDAAVHKPGRPNGKTKAVPSAARGWNESSDEEEEEEDDDDDDASSDDEPRAASASRTGHSQAAPSAGEHGDGMGQPGGLRSRTPVGDSAQRPPRSLPQIPGAGRAQGTLGPEYPQGGPRMRTTSEHRQRGPYEEHPMQAQPGLARPQPEYPHQLAAARQNIWSNALEAGRDSAMPGVGGMNAPARDTFIQLESPSETMTKAFTPQGLLSAGLQDKQDRSAKRQEEVARETGASLINVPIKPPPPATGLLGAISAHERERNREGGMGAALTEREREKRVAEEKQRKLDEYTRQQLEQHQQMAQSGMYGMYGGGGLTPQMTGFNPMMSGYFPQMMPPFFNPMFGGMGYSPQHMYAAQQAAQAYQQAMATMSAAGSQIGGEGGNAGAAGGMGEFGGATGQPNPMMGGMGLDPRMSMMSMGMPMGMGMGMPMGGPLGMQMTGGSGMGFDPRTSMTPSQFNNGMQPGGEFPQRLSPFQGNTPREGSPARQIGEGGSEQNRRAASTSPAPKP